MTSLMDDPFNKILMWRFKLVFPTFFALMFATLFDFWGLIMLNFSFCFTIQITFFWIVFKKQKSEIQFGPKWIVKSPICPRLALYPNLSTLHNYALTLDNSSMAIETTILICFDSLFNLSIINNNLFPDV